jgi:hypothetical protein
MAKWNCSCIGLAHCSLARVSLGLGVLFLFLCLLVRVQQAGVTASLSLGAGERRLLRMTRQLGSGGTEKYNVHLTIFLGYMFI